MTVPTALTATFSHAQVLPCLDCPLMSLICFAWNPGLLSFVVAWLTLPRSYPGAAAAFCLVGREGDLFMLWLQSGTYRPQDRSFPRLQPFLKIIKIRSRCFLMLCRFTTTRTIFHEKHRHIRHTQFVAPLMFDFDGKAMQGTGDSLPECIYSTLSIPFF